MAHVIGHAGPCSHADRVPQVRGGAGGQRWLPASTGERAPGIMNRSGASTLSTAMTHQARTDTLALVYQTGLSNW